MSTGLIGGNSFGIAYARARDGVDPGQLEDELVGEVERLATDGPSERELRRAKAQYERHWLHELARIDSRADALGEFATLHGDPNLVNSRIDDVEAVSPEDIADVMARWFRADQRSTLTYRKAAAE